MNDSIVISYNKLLIRDRHPPEKEVLRRESNSMRWRAAGGIFLSESLPNTILPCKAREKANHQITTKLIESCQSIRRRRSATYQRTPSSPLQPTYYSKKKTMTEESSHNQRNENERTENSTMNSSYHYVSNVTSGGGSVRIATPTSHDVLSGRGGAINSHPGNAVFREWVRERKNRYNLARTKAEKARVANEVIDLVRNQNPPGRFLQRDSSSMTGGVSWWVEVDEAKAMAKTSQALREGAPSIRAAHKDELQSMDSKRSKRSRSKKSTPISPTDSKPAPAATMPQLPAKRTQPTMSSPPMPSSPEQMPPPKPLELTKSEAIQELKHNAEAAAATKNGFQQQDQTYVPIIPPLMSNSAFESAYGQPQNKKARTDNSTLRPRPHIVKPDEETPPLEPLPSPVPLNSIPSLGEDLCPPEMPKRDTSLKRFNSLALSDIGSNSDNWGEVEFVNPFEGDTSDEVSNSPSKLLPPMSPLDRKQSSNNGYNSNGVRSRNSVRSFTSELSDLNDAIANAGAPAESDFGEGMKAVYDAVHPGLTAPGNDDQIPTHLYPYRAGSFDLNHSQSSRNKHSSPQLIC